MSCFVNLIGNFFLPFFKTQSTVQYSFGSKALISSSLSHINFNAADWTLPALNPHLTFFQRIGLISYPTNLSNTLLACWASTKFKLIFLASLIDSFTAPLVISLKTILQVSSSEIFRILAKCQDIASPSLSGSVARYTLSAFFAAFFNLLINSPFPLIVIYFGVKFSSISTPNYF